MRLLPTRPVSTARLKPVMPFFPMADLRIDAVEAAVTILEDDPRV
jgi:hypothetical protein